ncbi:MAG: 2-C-methyl-D-erythritol 2,4-cyclodiphosphate synthase [Candidatus Omnitrophica bacterium]|jgi:2C-methyl-D-erythritol 2,4-cyclodiphosphate synthase|nr:2-C-methyl-D-erythritol 2,4-cyclodiphosphate synthase [Candidatus Omnitrophota bacterium]
MKGYRVGLGFDVHRFSKKKRPLVLGGVEIASNFGLEAVSDGDVLLHAASDAICGACALGDIGDYFPPQNIKSKGIDSRKIVQFILKKIKNKFNIINIDATIITEKPKLSVHKKRILTSLREIFQTKAINVKIKSKEGLDILGSKKAISCLALAVVKKC